MGQGGKPIYDQKFFLALVRCGKDAWNRWRQANPEVKVSFEGVNFEEPQKRGITFSKFNLGDGTFGRCANLSGATFGYDVDLSGATFGDDANLSGATFMGIANLMGVSFGNWADLSGATFGDHAILCGAAFGHRANLSGVTFGHDANLSRVTFRGAVDLRASIDDWREQMKGRGSRFPDQRRQVFTQARPDAFSDISFARTNFRGTADFSGRIFLEGCDLTGARFSQPPKFGDCKGTSNIDLYGATIRFSSLIRGWTTRSEIPVCFRALRKLADETKNHDLERDLYIEERKAERGTVLAQYWRDGASEWRVLAHCSWIAVMGVYWLLSDYGRSFIRPIVALVCSVFVSYWAYLAVLESVVVLESPNAAATRDFKDAVWAYAIANAVPFVGALTLEKEVKTTLLCGGRADYRATVAGGVPSCVPISPRRFQLITIRQSIFSAICIFFAGLALRNYFKLR
jgi:uncharacterized protein YjbI with pentapeptide repeats